MPSSQPTPSQPGPHAGTATVRRRELVLIKRGQRYVFRYAPGEEARALESIAEMARDPESDFDWFDAAVLSHQMSKNLSQQLKQMSGRK